MLQPAQGPGNVATSSLRALVRALLGGVAMAVVWPCIAQAGPVSAGNQIVPTGRTDTKLSVSGAVTDITTGTMAGGNAYNDFSQFSTVSGTTVNLQVPSGANNLVNVVRNAPATVNGVLNSYKNGQIGGNVVFADPYGFIVGASGVVNVGTLTVRTPTRDFLDQLIGPNGAISSAAAAALQSGDIPLSPDGRISIRGKVNAVGDVTLSGQSVSVGRDPASIHAARFAATVNKSGLRTGAAIVSRNGGIDIVAAGHVSINGRLATGAASRRSAGVVTVRAGANVVLGSKTVIDTHGAGDNSSGGAISIKAAGDLSLSAGATFDSYAGRSGDGGQIEISATGKETLGGGIFNAGATSGIAGAVTFDPAAMEISGVNTTVNGTDFVATAGSITVDSGAVIVTRQVAAGLDPTDPTVASTGKSGNIALTATGGAQGVITIDPGAQLLAFATDAFAAGNVTLNAGSGSIVFPTDPNLTANALIATRVVASGTGASLTGSVSSGNSGNITLTAATLQLGSGINTAATSAAAPGEQFLANAASSSTCATTCAAYTPGTITFNVGSYSFSAASPVLTEGANLVVNASGTVTFAAGSLINTRHQAAVDTDTSGSLSTTYFSPADPTSAILDNPGNVTVNASAIAYPASINSTSGAAIYAGGYGGADGFLPGTITFNIPNLTVTGTIASAGANLTLNATTGSLTIASGAVLATREVTAGADPTDPTVASADVSGDLTLTTAAGGNIVIDPQAQLLTFSTDQYYAGDIKILSGASVIFAAPGAGQSSAKLVARAVSSSAAASGGYYAASSANSGNVTLSAGSGGSLQLGAGINSGAGPVILAGAAAGGVYAYKAGTLTLSAPTISVAAGESMDTLGADLALTGVTAVTIASGAAINTRDVASGADPSNLANLSTENSGSVTITAPGVAIGAGAAINASAVGDYALTGENFSADPGNVAITATTSLSLASGVGGSAIIEARGVAAGAASIPGGSADAAGGAISITAPSISLSNGINTTQGLSLLAAGGGGNAGGTIALTAGSFDVSSTLKSLGANLSLTASSGNVILENSAVIDTTTAGGAAGDITVAGASVVLPDNAVNASGSVTLNATASGGASPGTITFSETSNLDYTVASLAVTTSGANFALQTTGGLTLGPKLSIDTRDLSGGAVVGPGGDIGLIANAITLGTGFNGGGTTATLRADAGAGYAPGTILLQWTGSGAVSLAAEASFNSAGANLAFDAAGAISIEDAATVNAGDNTATIFGATVQAAPTSIFDAAAVKFGETAASSNFVISSNMAFGGINLTIATDGSITVDEGVILSTRKTASPFAAVPGASTGNSGSITLEAPIVTVLGTLDAGVTNAAGSTYSAGDVTLQAAQIEQPVAAFGNTTATTTISLGDSSGVKATIKGADVSLMATATSDSEPFATLETAYITLGVSSVLQVLGQINGSVQIATGTSEAQVYGGATIAATGNVVVQAVSVVTASNVSPDTPDFINVGLTNGESVAPSLARAVGLPLNSAFAVMEATSTANALVDSGATITAGGTLTVRAHNTDTIHSEESIVSTNNTVDIAVAYSSADINSTATIAKGAIVNAGAVRVIALNDNAWETSAEVADMGQGKGGIVLALSENDTSNATAQMNANLALPTNLPAGADASLLVEAQSVTTDNVVSASAESGSGDISAKAIGSVGGGLASGANSAVNAVSGWLGSTFALSLSNVFANNNATLDKQVRFAFGVALNLGDTQSATATIGGATGSDAPTVTAGGPVAVIAGVTDSGVQTQALSTIRSTSYGQESTSFPGTTYGFGGAFALTDLTHNSDAEIGVQADVTAPAVAVSSTIYVPLSLPIADWGTPKAIMDNILSFLPTLLENSTAEVDTTGANAVANAQQLGVSGSVDIFNLSDHATAWVDQGASITASPAAASGYASGNWSVGLDTGDDAKAGIAQTGDSGDPTQAFAATVSVAASDTVAAINIGGGIDFIGVLHPVNGSSNTAGAAFSETDFSQTTLAGIAKAASVNTSDSLEVDATALDFIITLVPSATNSGQLALSGMIGLSILNNDTEATISNGADITSGLGVTVDAAQYLNNSIVGGALFQKGSTVAFGVGIGINLPTTDTEAFIGDNSSLDTAIDPDSVLASNFVAPAAQVSAPDVTVFALTSGQVLSLGFAGSLTVSSSESHDEPEPDEPDQSAAGAGNGNISNSDSLNGIANKLAFLDNILPNWPAGPELPELPDFGLAVSGSAAVVQDALTTQAYVQGATLIDTSAGPTDTVKASAVRNLWLIAGAGGFAASTADSAQTNVDVAGALALDISNNLTHAYITGSSVSGFNTVQAAALEGGQQIDVGLDAAVTLAEGGTSVGVAVSASIGLVNDSVESWIQDSTITGQGGALGQTSVVAYNNTNIGMGGGAFLVNFGSDGGGSAGAGVTFGEINDPSSGEAAEAYINDSTVTNFGTVSVEAASAGRIIMGALSGAVTDQSTGVGAITYAQIETTTSAAITGGSTISAGSVTVEANGGAQSTLDSQLAQYGTVAYSSISDFSGSQVLSVLDSSSTSAAPTKIGTGGAAIIAIAGTISIGLPGEDSGATANVGLQLTINDVADTYSATVADSTITTPSTGSVTVAANDSATILAISAGAAISVSSSDSFNLTGLGSLTINLDNDKATATVGDATGAQYGTSISTGALSVTANNAAITDAFAGNVDISTSENSAAFGASIAFAQDKQTTSALLTNSKLDVDGETAVQAATNPVCVSDCPVLPYTIADAAFTVAASGNLAFAGAVTANVVENTTTARASAISLNDPAIWAASVYPATDNTSLVVTSSDNSTVGTIAISVAGATTAGVGAGISYGDMANVVTAAIDGDGGASAQHPAIDVGGVLVQATSTPNIETLAAGIAGGEEAGIGGSIVTNFVGLDTSLDPVATATATIDQDAIVSALGNIYVLANDDSSVQVVAGSLGVSAGGEPGVGIGLGVIVNDIDTAAKAEVVNSQVDAAGQTPSTLVGGVSTVDDGTLSSAAGNAPDVSDISAPRVATYAMAENQKTVHGLAVDANAVEQVIADTVSIGLQASEEPGAGIGVNVLVNLISGSTTADITDSRIDTTYGANTLPSGYVTPDVFVNASSHAFAGDFVVAVAASGYAGLAGAADAANVQRSTNAYISGGQIGSVVQSASSVTNPYNAVCASGSCSDSNDTLTVTTLTPIASIDNVTVNAATTADTADIVIGAAAAAGSGAGSVAVDIFSPSTSAYVGAGTPVIATNLSVDATTENGNNMLGGAVAVGGVAGAGSFGVLVSNDTTNAYVGDQASEATTTTLALTGSLSVQSEMTDNFNSLVVSGALAGSVGVAGMADVLVVTNTTTGGLYLVGVGATGAETSVTGPIAETSDGVYAQTVTNTYGGDATKLTAPGSVSVDATETVNVAANAGALGVGISGAGLGAGATVIVLKSNTTAVAYDDAINATGEVQVDAASTKTIQATAVSLGAGGSVGIGASALLILVGSAPSGGLDAIESELNASNSGTLSKLDSAGGTGTSTGASDSTATPSAPTYSVSNEIDNNSTDSVTASIEGGSVVADTLDVEATGEISTSSIVGGAGLSLGLGIGGGVGYTLIYDTVTATVYGGTFDANAITVAALAEDATPALSKYPGTANVLAIAGGAGLVGLGAAYADGTVDDTVNASIGGRVGTASALAPASGVCASGVTTCLAVSANDTASATVGAYGAEIGAVAAGVVVGQAAKTSTVGATVLADSVLSGFAATTISAKQSGEVEADTIGAAGGLLGAGTGAASTATTLTQVTASTGSDVTLPDGDFSLLAVNDPNDQTSALGVAAGGLFAAGVGVAESYAGAPVSNREAPIDSTQSTYTAAMLGAGAITDPGRTGALNLSATSASVVDASGTAGAGGGIAGAAALATTNDTALTETNLGQPQGTLYAGAVTVQAAHTTNFGGQTDSIAASVVGGSGASTENEGDVATSVTVGPNASVVATGAVTISASDSLMETVSGDAASGGAGGVLTGSAALVDSNFTLGATVTLESDTSIRSGTDPITNPGAIAIGAGILAAVGDTAELNTGGVVAGAAARNSLTLTPTTDVEIGQGDTLYSNGALGVGSYIQVEQASTNAYSNTYGLAAVGDSSTSVTIAASQTTHIGSGANINGLGSVWVTAGLDPSGSIPTLINSAPDAEAYAYGLVGVPVVNSSADLSSNTTLTIDAGASILSALNVTLGGYPGAPYASPSATGKGDILGIPTTSGTATPTTSSSADVTMNGSAVAGEYNTLLITVDPSQCLSNGSCAANEIEGYPTTITYNPSQDLVTLVNTYFPEQPAQGAALASVPTIGAPTVTIGTLYAAGGLVFMNATQLTGNGSLTANGGPTITVNNPSNAFVVLGEIEIPGQPGGSVLFTGAANAQSDSSLRVATSASNIGQITVNATGDGATGGVEPGLIFTGGITAITGNVLVNNSYGSIALANSVIAISATLTAPNGIETIGSGTTPEYLAGNPFSEWDATILYPGGDPNTVTPNADVAVAYAANAIDTDSVAQGTQQYSSFLYGAGQGTSSYSGAGSGAYGYNYVSQVWFGNCFPAAGGDCSSGTANAISAALGANGNYVIDPSSSKYLYYFALVPVESLTKTVSATPNTAAFTNAMGGLVAQQITIQGSYIAIGGDLILGSPTTVSLDIPASDDLALGILHAVSASPYTLIKDAAGNPLVTYEPVQNQLVVANINAAATASQILLDGKILGVNPDAEISVNTGLGTATVTNETGVPLTLNTINAGSDATNLTSTVQIIDTLRNTNSIYRYTSGKGLQQYETSDLSLICKAGTDCTGGAATSATNSVTYLPEQGTRLDWTLYAELTRNVSGVYTDWAFVTPPLTTNPWQYASYDIVNGQAAAQLATNGQSSDPAFSEKITAQEENYAPIGIFYHGCGSDDCHYGFPANSTQKDSNGGNGWLFEFPTDVVLDLSMTVRSDYSFGINFGGSSTGSISVTSNSPITVAGTLYNPDGATVLNSSGSAPALATAFGLVSSTPNGIYATNGAAIIAGDLTLTTTGAVGTPTSLVPVSLTRNASSGAYGLLNVSAGSQGVNLAINSGATLGQISSTDGAGVYGDITIKAESDLAAQATAEPITGRNINVTVASGGLGSAATPVGLDPNGNGGASGGVVDIAALGSIYINRSGGDLLAGAIASEGGDVVISVPDGMVLDASAQTPLSVLAPSQVAAIATKLGITVDGEASASVMANTVNPTQATVDGYYGLYWNLVGTLLPNGTVTGNLYAAGSTFSIDPASAAYKIYAPLAQQYENQQARANGVAAGTVTQADVEAYVNGLYQSIVTLYAPAFAQFYGAGWLSLPAFATESAAPTIFSSAAVSALEVNSSQSAAALLNSAVSYNALQPAGSSVVGIGTPNVVGQSVTITQAEAVGRLGAPLDIPFASILDGSLTTPQSEALGLATSPGQASFEVQTSGGATLSIPITQLSLNGGQYYYTPTGGAAVPVTVTNVVIQEPAPLFVAVNGALNVTSGGSVYAQSTIPNLPVGTIVAQGPVNLSAPQSISSALAAGVANIVASHGGVSLAAATGSIGSLALPLTISVNDAPAVGALTSVSAGGDAYLNYIGGDLTVGSVFANGTASISSQYGIFAADDAVNITAHDIVLSAQRDIGSSTAALQVQVGAGGALSGSAGGVAYIFSPTESNQAPVTLAVSNFISARDMDLTADGPISASDVTATNGAMTVASGSDVTLTDATSAGAMTVTAAGDLTVGALTTTSIHSLIDLTAGANGALTVEAGAAVTSAAGVTTRSDSVDMQAGSTVTAQGPVGISTTGDAVLGAIDALAGAIDVTSDGDVGRILSNGDAAAALTAAGAGGSIALIAGGDIGAPSLPIHVATPLLSAASSHGGIWIVGEGDLDATSLSAPEGALFTSASGNLTVGIADAGLTLTLVGDTGLTAGTVTSGGDASLTALAGPLTLTDSLVSQGGAFFDAEAGDASLPSVTAATFLTAEASGALALGTLSSGGAMTLSGGRDVTFDSLATTVDGDIAVTSTSGDITGASPGTISSAGDAALTATAGSVALASIDAATTISVSAGETASIATLTSGGSETLTAGALNLGTVTTTGTASDPGDVTLAAGSGGVVAGAMTIAGTATITSQGAISLTDVTAGGTITSSSVGAVAFNTLTAAGTGGDPGDIGVSAGGAISGQDIDAHRNIALTSTGGTIDVNEIVAETGSALASGSGDVTLPSVIAAGSFTASSGGTLNLVDATSGGTQALSAAGAIEFARLQANGTASDPGDIGLKAGGAISGQDIDAHRNIALTSTGGTIDVSEIVAATGSALASGAGDVTLPSVTAAGAFTASSGGSLTLDTATTGGTQTLYATDEVKFVQLTTHGLTDDAGDVDITAVTGPILGGNIDAAGSVRLNGYGVRFGTILAGGNGVIISGAGVSGDRVSVGDNLLVESGPGDIDLGAASGRTLDLEAGGAITITQLTVRDRLTMRAEVINGAIDQAPGTTNPFVLDVTGPHGGLAQEVDLRVGAPNGLVLPEFSAIDATLITTAVDLVGQFDVPGRLSLETAEATLLLDNSDTQPEKNVDVQLYQPGGQFFLDQNGTVTDTNAYVIAYQQAFQVFEAAFTDDHTEAFPEFDGSSVVRDAIWNTAQDMREAEDATETDDVSLKLLLERLRQHIPLVAMKPGLSGPAVNLNR